MLKNWWAEFSNIISTPLGRVITSFHFHLIAFRENQQHTHRKATIENSDKRNEAYSTWKRLIRNTYTNIVGDEKQRRAFKNESNTKMRFR